MFDKSSFRPLVALLPAFLLTPCLSFGQSSTNKQTTNTVVAPTALLKAKENRFSVSLDLIQGQPNAIELKNPVTWSEVNFGYRIHDELDFVGTISFSQRWGTEFREERFRFDDVFLGFSRPGLVTWTALMSFPTSKLSQDEKRQFSLSVEPRITLENDSWWFRAKSEFLLSKNSDVDFLSSGASDAEAHSLWTQLYLQYKFYGSWLMTSHVSHYHSVSYKSEIVETRVVNVGPGYKFNKKASLKLLYYSEETPKGSFSMFDTNASGVKLAFRIRY